MISDRTSRRIFRSHALVASTGDLLRGLLGALMVTALVWCVAYDAILARMMFADLHMNDFGRFYYSTRAFLNGGELYAPTPATAVVFSAAETLPLANMNPPHFHLLLLCRGRLPGLRLITTTIATITRSGSSTAWTCRTRC